MKIDKVVTINSKFRFENYKGKQPGMVNAHLPLKCPYSLTHCRIFKTLRHVKCYSPAAIIRNVKIWNIILLLAFFRTLSSNLDLEYPAVSEENCLSLLPLP